MEVSCSSQLYPKPYMMNNHLATYASFLLAKALKDLFPKIQLVGGFSQNALFSYDFIADFPLDSQGLQFLNDRLNELFSQDIEISFHEMLRDGAMQMFDARGEKTWGFMLKDLDKKELVPLARVGSTYFLADFEIPDLKGLKGVSKLLFSTEESVYLPRFGVTSVRRVTGFVENDQSSLKEKLKKIKGVDALSHIALGKKGGLFEKCCEEIIYTGKGAFAMRALEGICSEAYESQNFDCIRTPNYSLFDHQENQNFAAPLWDKRPYVLGGDRLDAHASYWQSQSKEKDKLCSAEASLFFRKIASRETRGLWLAKSFTRDESFCFVPCSRSKEALISSLHFIQINVNIDGIEGLWSLLPGANEAMEGGGSMPYEALMQNESFFNVEFKKGKINPKRFALFYRDAFLEPWEGPSVELIAPPTHVGEKIRALMGWKEAPVLIKTSLFGSFERFLAFCLEKRKTLPSVLRREHGMLIVLNGTQLDFAKYVDEEAKKRGLHLHIVMKEKLESFKIDLFDQCEALPTAYIEEARDDARPLRFIEKTGNRPLTVPEFLSLAGKEEGDWPKILLQKGR